MITCLKDYVFPFYGCNAPSGTPPSGLYLTNLPGISFKAIQEISTEEQVDWNGVWSDIQIRAQISFGNDIIEEFQKRYLLKQIAQTVDLGLAYDTTILTPKVAGTQQGIAIETYMAGNYFAGSNLQNIYVQSVNFYYYDALSGSPTLTCTVIDADLGTPLYTTTITPSSDTPLVQGWNTLKIEQKFSTRRILIFFSGTFTQYVNLNISNALLNNFGWYGNCGQGWGWGIGDWLLFQLGGCQARTNGVTVVGGNYTSTALNFNYNTFGTSAVFSIQCSFDNVVCANKNYFASAWLYCLGKEFIDELKYSSRLNRWTTIDSAKYEELGNEFELKYRGGQDFDGRAMRYGLKNLKLFPGILRQAVTGLVLNQYDCCLQPNGIFRSQESRL